MLQNNGTEERRSRPREGGGGRARRQFDDPEIPGDWKKKGNDTQWGVVPEKVKAEAKNRARGQNTGRKKSRKLPRRITERHILTSAECDNLCCHAKRGGRRTPKKMMAQEPTIFAIEPRP